MRLNVRKREEVSSNEVSFAIVVYPKKEEREERVVGGGVWQAKGRVSTPWEIQSFNLETSKQLLLLYVWPAKEGRDANGNEQRGQLQLSLPVLIFVSKFKNRSPHSPDRN